MERLTECQSCGYKLRKNSKRILINVDIDITICGDKIVSNMILCNECKDDLLTIVNNVINNYTFIIE